MVRASLSEAMASDVRFDSAMIHVRLLDSREISALRKLFELEG